MPSIRHAFPAVLIAALCLCLIACSRSNTPPNNPPPPPVNPTDTSHWKKIQAIDEGQAITDIWFTDSLHGIICTDAGKIYISEDGGQSFKLIVNPQPSPDPALSINFLDKLHGFIISSQHFYYTSDGGNSWASKKSPVSYNYNIFGNSSYPNLQFVSPSTGYLTGEFTPLLMTTDTGSTWKEITNSKTSGIYFTSTTEGWTYAYPDSILYTSDGGLHWQLTGRVSIPKPPISGYISPYNILQFSSPKNGWFMLVHQLNVTVDGGNTWKTLKGPQSVDSTLFTDFQMLDNKNGYLLTFSEILKTNDGGQNWESDYKIGTFYSGLNFLCLYAVDANHVWACATKGAIYKYIP